MGANLPAIESQEENVYIQHRHNGDKAWIGLNDIATEGVFAWVERKLTITLLNSRRLKVVP